jgi:Fe-S cluster assembly scaffold protein SufB
MSGRTERERKANVRREVARTVRREVVRTVRRDLEERFLIEAGGDERRTVRLKVEHARPGLSSRVAICVLAAGRAQVQLDATAVITEAAHDSKVWLEIRVITRDEAMVTAAPNLEIRNDAVRAGHALTTKHITEDEVFYLMARGVPRAEAEQLMVEALVAPYRDGTVVG